MSERVTLPLKVAFTGPTATLAVACSSVSLSFSSASQPGMHCFRISGSLSAAQTVARSAGSTTSPRQWDEFRVHVRGALNNGLTRDELKEALLHMAVYGGFPTARTGFKEAEAVMAQMDAEAGQPGAPQSS